MLCGSVRDFRQFSISSVCVVVLLVGAGAGFPNNLVALVVAVWF
jgi:hypothetical protein